MNRKDLERDFVLLNAGYAGHDADWNWKEIYSPFARIHYVKSGAARIVREDGIFDLRKDHLYLTPSYTKHGYECRGTLELYYLHIYEYPAKRLNIFDSLDFPVEIEANELDIHLIERLIEICPERQLQYYDPKQYDTSSSLDRQTSLLDNKSPFACEMEIQGIIRQLISRFLVSAVHKNKHIEGRVLKSLHYIHGNLDEPIDIDHLAQMSFLTKDHFIRLFKKEMGSTPGKYINKKKMEIAQLRILTDNGSIKDVAYGLGFDNMAYFNRLFTKLTGETPGRYKKRKQH